jgi:hypothetical protein
MEKRAPAAAIAGGRTASKSWPSSSPGPVRLAVQRRGESDASGGGSCGVAGARSETFTVTGSDAGCARRADGDSVPGWARLTCAAASARLYVVGQSGTAETLQNTSQKASHFRLVLVKFGPEQPIP